MAKAPEVVAAVTDALVHAGATRAAARTHWR